MFGPTQYLTGPSTENVIIFLKLILQRRKDMQRPLTKIIIENGETKAYAWRQKSKCFVIVEVSMILTRNKIVYGTTNVSLKIISGIFNVKKRAISIFLILHLYEFSRWCNGFQTSFNKVLKKRQTWWEREKLVKWHVWTWTAKSFLTSKILSVEIPFTTTHHQLERIVFIGFYYLIQFLMYSWIKC